MVHRIKVCLSLSKDYVLQTQVCTQGTYGKSLVMSQIAMAYGYMPDTARAASKLHDLIHTQKPALILKRKIHLTSDCYQFSCYRTDSKTKTLSNELPVDIHS